MHNQQNATPYEETPHDEKKRLKFEAEFKQLVTEIFQMKGKKMLVDKYNQWVDKMSTNLDCLD